MSPKPRNHPVSDEPTGQVRISFVETLERARRAGLAEKDIVALEERLMGASGNALRAGVLGANDGLVSNLSLVMGVAGAAISHQAVLLAGFAGLLAGSLSMALGEWLSVESARELHQHQLEVEAMEIHRYPDAEEAELVGIYRSKGLSEPAAQQLAASMMRDKSSVLDTMAREELGLNPGDLGGSPWTAAFTSFGLFSLGAIVPVAPFLFLRGGAAIAWSLALSAVALFAIGAGITYLTGRSSWWAGMRQVVFGLGSAGLTYLIGHWLGVAIGG